MVERPPWVPPSDDGAEFIKAASLALLSAVADLNGALDKMHQWAQGYPVRPREIRVFAVSSEMKIRIYPWHGHVDFVAGDSIMSPTTATTELAAAGPAVAFRALRRIDAAREWVYRVGAACVAEWSARRAIPANLRRIEELMALGSAETLKGKK
jgi:hypothetical protein